MRIDAHYPSATAASASEQQRVRTPPNQMEPQDGSSAAAQIQQSGATARVSATAANSRSAQGSDMADISGIAPSFSEFAGAVHTAPDVRAAKVQALRAAVEQGTYQVSPERIADSMLAQATSKLRWRAAVVTIDGISETLPPVSETAERSRFAATETRHDSVRRRSVPSPEELEAEQVDEDAQDSHVLDDLI